MGSAAGPKTVLNGITSLLDAGSSKSWNVGVSTKWTDMIGSNDATIINTVHNTDGPFVGAGYVEFDGTSDYLDIASSTDFAFGTGDFTIEVWVYLKANSVGVIYSNEVANSLFLYLNSGNLVVRNYGTTNLFDLAGPSLNTWTHIALSRSGTDLRLFFNGVQQGSTVTNSTNWTQNGTEIGAFNNGTQSLNGYMSNLRVVKGTALYTAAFTPPTKSLTAITNTVLLTCQGNTIADASSSGHTLTANQDAAAKLGFPASAFEFDGTANTRMTIPNTSDFDFAGGNFTLEWWGRYTADTASGDAIITKGWDTVYAPFLIQLTSATQLTFYASGSGSAWNVSSGNAIHTGIEREVWYHYVLTRSGSSFKGYVNGVETMSFTSSTALMSNSDEITIGSGDDGHSTSELNGYISNLKVYKGKALTVAEITQNYTALKGRYGY